MTAPIHIWNAPRRDRNAKYAHRYDLVPTWSGTPRATRRLYRDLRRLHLLNPTQARCIIIRASIAFAP